MQDENTPATVSPEAPAVWIWQGLLAPGCITVLSGESRVGKSRLVRALLGHRRQGKPFLDLPVRRGITIAATAEHERFWEWQLQSARIDSRTIYHIERRLGGVSEEQFAALQKAIIAAKERESIDLLVFDPLAQFVPAPLDPAPASIAGRLRPFTDAGFAVLLVDPPGPLTPAPFADIHLELRRLSLTNPSSGRRRLVAHRGFAETPASIRFAMDYHWSTARVLPEAAKRTNPPHWPAIKQLLEQSAEKLTRNDLLARWPDGSDRPSKITLWRWLEGAWAQGQLDREGMGTTKEPYRYGLPTAAPSAAPSAPVP